MRSKIKNLISIFLAAIMLFSSTPVYAEGISYNYDFIFYWDSYNEEEEPIEIVSTAVFNPSWNLNKYVNKYNDACRKRDKTSLDDPKYFEYLEDIEKILASWNYYINCLNNFGINSENSIEVKYNELEQVTFDPEVSESYYINLYHYYIAVRNSKIKEYEYYKYKYPYNNNIRIYYSYITATDSFYNNDINKAIFLYNYYLIYNANLL